MQESDIARARKSISGLVDVTWVHPRCSKNYHSVTDTNSRSLAHFKEMGVDRRAQGQVQEDKRRSTARN